jgi:F0F1-type ATP synthase assembly protein I
VRDNDSDSGPAKEPHDLTWSGLLGIGGGSAVVIVAGVTLGWWVDSSLHTSPIFILVGIALGIAGGVSFTITRIRSYLKE